MRNRSRKRISRSNKSMSKSPKKISVKSKTLHFKDFPEFKPNLTPKQVLQLGSFGGTYFRDIHSTVTNKNYIGKNVIKEFPSNWFTGLDIDSMVTSQKYDKNVRIQLESVTSDSDKKYDVIITDPPYGDDVQYGELSEFFYDLLS